MKATSWDGVSLVCTAPYHKDVVLAGGGMQFVDEEGELQRYCWTAWKKREAEREATGNSSGLNPALGS